MNLICSPITFAGLPAATTASRSRERPSAFVRLMRRHAVSERTDNASFLKANYQLACAATVGPIRRASTFQHAKRLALTPDQV